MGIGNQNVTTTTIEGDAYAMSEVLETFYKIVWELALKIFETARST